MVKNEVVKNEVVKNEVVKNEVVKNDLVKNEVVKNEVINNELIKNEVVKIPKIIWQTYKTNLLPNKVAYNCHMSWKNKNPEWELRYSNDNDLENFFKNEFNGKYYKSFSKLPLGVMKADYWRYAIILKYGGIYTDLDTECIVPIKFWKNINNKNIIIGLENYTHICQWTFGAVPNHPFMNFLIEIIHNKIMKGIDFSSEHFVHYTTGPGIFTDSFYKYMKYSTSIPLLSIYNKYYKNDNENNEICMYKLNIFKEVYVKHLYASQNWKKNYVSWINERFKYIKK